MKLTQQLQQSSQLPSDNKQSQVIGTLQMSVQSINKVTKIEQQTTDQSLTYILCKQMEHIASHVMSHLNQNNLLYKIQHGFCSKLSCETQLKRSPQMCSRLSRDRKQCDAIIMGFSKALDRVSPRHLNYNFQRIGIDKHTVG